MKNKLMLLSLALAGLLLAGCATSARLNDMRIGMTKDQVIALLGTPDSTSAQANVEYLTYYLEVNTPNGAIDRTQPYFVRLVNGRVESYGRYTTLQDLYNRPVTSAQPGDPNFPQNLLLSPVGPVPAAAAAPSGATDLAGQISRLKALKDQGVLTDEEFQKAKEKLLSEQK
ncbi:MAG TPA: SHOCT domain-containing protein [Opitutaceae bacterium]|nr:SHOCT domain-containing protein [Opitutaceae bacterium]